MKFLNGAELAGFIKERQAKQVRNLRQEHKIIPKMVILMSEQASKPSQTYVNLKKRYGDDILIQTDIQVLPENKLLEAAQKASLDNQVHGVILQLPLQDGELAEKIIQAIDDEKDIDGLKNGPSFVSATAEAINWLLNGYNIELAGRKICLVGRGRLVGAPLERLWQQMGYDVSVVDVKTSAKERVKKLSKSQIIVTATGSAESVLSSEIPNKAVVVDAGVADVSGQLKGDLEESVYEQRQDLTLTPKKGGVGPLTVAALYDHLIEAALKQAFKK